MAYREADHLSEYTEFGARTQPTAGPWSVEQDGLEVVANNGRNLIADLDFAACGEIDEQTVRANAQLIAAAPDLLRLARLVASEPCRSVQILRTDCETWLLTHPSASRCTFCEARLVLAKAEGR